MPDCVPIPRLRDLHRARWPLLDEGFADDLIIFWRSILAPHPWRDDIRGLTILPVVRAEIHGHLALSAAARVRSSRVSQGNWTLGSENLNSCFLSQDAGIKIHTFSVRKREFSILRWESLFTLSQWNMRISIHP